VYLAPSLEPANREHTEFQPVFYSETNFCYFYFGTNFCILFRYQFTNFNLGRKVSVLSVLSFLFYFNETLGKIARKETILNSGKNYRTDSAN
jgi:hypothetical protein